VLTRVDSQKADIVEATAQQVFSMRMSAKNDNFLVLVKDDATGRLFDSVSVTKIFTFRPRKVFLLMKFYGGESSSIAG
jgi:hypothetical protein